MIGFEFFRKFFQTTKGSGNIVNGSGFLVDGNGHIVTNSSVVDKASKIEIKLMDGRVLESRLIGADPRTNIAVLKIQMGYLPKAELGNSDDLKAGETIFAIGAPFGLNISVTQGIVSGLGRTSIGLQDYENFIQTDVPLPFGFGGGPLVNLNGEIVGINTAIFSRSRRQEGVSFSIPINQARPIIKTLIETGKVTRGYLGVVIQDINQELADDLGLKNNVGVLITQVGGGTPAENGGIKPGDIITHINGRPINNSTDLRNTVGALRPGNTFPMDLIRGGKGIRLMVTPGEQPKIKR